MTGSTDMSTPVTRGELREELEQLKQQFELRLAPLATKAELEIWGGALLERIKSSEQQLTERIKSSEQQLIRTEQRLHVELARHATALYESLATLIVASNEEYADLPKRVGRLETAVFAPKPR